MTWMQKYSFTLNSFFSNYLFNINLILSLFVVTTTIFIIFFLPLTLAHSEEVSYTDQSQKEAKNSAVFVNLNDTIDVGEPTNSKNSSAVNQEKTSKVNGVSTVLVLTKAVMCESMKGFEPDFPAVAFSISLGKIFCFTGFDNISQNAFVYHKWYHRDRFVATNRFLVKAPQWSTFSTMQLRTADKGPWRVEVTDENDKLLTTLRFSVVD